MRGTNRPAQPDFPTRKIIVLAVRVDISTGYMQPYQTIDKYEHDQLVGRTADPRLPLDRRSSVGSEGTRQGIREFQETQYLSIDFP